MFIKLHLHLYRQIINNIMETKSKHSSKKQIKSIFTEIISNVYEAKCVTSCKHIIISRINKSGIKDIDRNIIIQNIDSLNTLIAVQKYATNSMFQYEGLGLKI